MAAVDIVVAAISATVFPNATANWAVSFKGDKFAHSLIPFSRSSFIALEALAFFLARGFREGE
jgi:hypothetical protein